MTGVVLPGGELVVTAASAVAGISQLDVVTASGKRMRGQVVGSDAHSGVAVISTTGGLAPATFADEDVKPSDIDIVACLCAQAPSSGPVRRARRRRRGHGPGGGDERRRSTAGPTSSTPSRPRCPWGRRRGAACSSTATAGSWASSTAR